MAAIDIFLSRLQEPDVRSFLKTLRTWHESSVGAKANPTEEEIRAAEETIGKALPASYRKLLLNSRPEEMPVDVYWIGDESGLEGNSLLTFNGDGSLPPFLIAVVDGNYGNQYCFDTRHVDPDGEYPIVLWNHEVHHEDLPETGQFERVSPDLGTFLLESLPGPPRNET